MVTPLATPGLGTPTAVVTPTSTPAPTYAVCTPGPRTPTAPPSPTPSPTPWARPTELPGIISNIAPRNISNQAGYDVEPSIAVHPTAGWAAVVWSNWVWEFPEEATIYVKVQDPLTRVWKRGIGVNTGPVEKGGGSPAIAIDEAGRIHVAFLQDNAPVYTMSSDQGTSWTDPVTIPGAQDGGYFFQLHIDAADQLHVLYATSPAFDEFSFVHAERPAAGDGTWRWQDRITSGRKVLFGDLTTVQLADGAIRTVVVVGCRTGCPPGPVVATQDGNGAAWIERTIPEVNIRVSPQVVQWIDTIAFTDRDGEGWICTAWGQYSTSAVHSSCSTDAGTSWTPPDVIAYHAPPEALPETTPEATPTSGEGENEEEPTFGAANYGFRPELLYEPSRNRLVVVWTYLERRGTTGATNPYYLVWSWRDLDSTIWWPRIDAPTLEPPLRLFANTRRNASRNQRLAYGGQGLAWVTWIELEADESIEVYVGPFTPAALLATEGR
jgi:hypothetical protein